MLGLGKKKDSPASRHSDALSNIRERKEGWKFAAIVLGIVSAVLAFSLVEASGRVTTVLEPYHISSVSGSLPYNINNLSRSQRYLALLARSDINTLTTWNTQTVRTQFATFLARCTPAAYQAWNLRLQKYQKRILSDNMTEIFFPQSESFVPPDSIALDGLLVRKMGHHTMFRRPVQYVVSYAPDNGIFSIANIVAQVQGSKIPRSVLHVQ